jgi:hypothetical protein
MARGGDSNGSADKRICGRREVSVGDNCSDL